jgi:hypothetical protein
MAVGGAPFTLTSGMRRAARRELCPPVHAAVAGSRQGNCAREAPPRDLFPS